MEARLLVGSVEDGSRDALFREKGSEKIDLEALSNGVLELDLGAEHVGGGPSVGDGEPVLALGPLGLDVTLDLVGTGGTVAADLEGDIGRGLGLGLEIEALELEVLTKEVVGGLAEVLQKDQWRTTPTTTTTTRSIPSRRGERAGAGTWWF